MSPAGSITWYRGRRRHTLVTAIQIVQTGQAEWNGRWAYVGPQMS